MALISFLSSFLKTIPMMVFIAAVFTGNSYAKDLAKINDRPVSDRDLQLSLAGLNEGQRSGLLSDPNLKMKILDSVIDRKMLAQEAEKLKLDQDPELKDLVTAFREQLLAVKLLDKKITG